MKKYIICDSCHHWMDYETPMKCLKNLLPVTKNDKQSCQEYEREGPHLYD